MSDATSVLFGLEHEFSVLEVERVDATTVKLIIEQVAREGQCPDCGGLCHGEGSTMDSVEGSFDGGARPWSCGGGSVA
jgi:hypothetical protein